MWYFLLLASISFITANGTGKIRLVNGTNSCSGRVEVQYNGSWGTVCDDFWDLTDAAVVCREMGCGNVMEAKSVAYFGQGSGPIWMDNVNCSGTELSLINCTTPGWGIHNCGHNKDAGVICNVVRLMDGDNSCSGRVEVFHDGQWWTVCADDWDLTEAKVVCRELGCASALGTSHAYFGQGSAPIWMNKTQCNGTEYTLESCRSDVIASCTKSAGVICQSSVLLVNGSHSCSGRVEIRYNGMWGTVCDDGWDLSDAKVVCREMGCGEAIEAKRAAYFGKGSGPVWMNKVSCNGAESALADCSLSGSGQQNCSHEKDAGVICGPKVRLQNDFNNCSGRVEVLHNGSWGRVCDNGWDQSAAAVVCREIGCENGVGASFGSSSGPIWLNNVNCNGNESTIKRCGSSGWDVGSMNGCKDAGVNCRSATSSSTTEVRSTTATSSSPENSPKTSSSTTEVKLTTAMISSPSESSSVSNDNFTSSTSSSSTEVKSTTATISSPRESSSVSNNLSSTILRSTPEVMSTSATASSPENDSSVDFNFTYINETKSWIDALGYCKAHHQTLAHILNATAQQYITQMLEHEEISNGVWIGLERDIRFTCSPWEWTGGPNVDYSAWNQYFPVKPRSSFCGKLLKDQQFGWVDACCYEQLPFICQG